MSKKKIIQIIAIVFLLLAIYLLIPNTDWGKSTSIYGFISLICGTCGSILSIFIPSSYTYYFDSQSWGQDRKLGYQLIISSKKHGLGKAPHIQTFERVSDSFEEVGVACKHDIKGNVSIASSAVFEGKVIITS